jgi:betaine-homocysteine S-methyltransferase
MLPIIEKIRSSLDGFVAVQPVTYRTTPDQPYFLDLQEPEAPSAFPLGLDPFQPTRFEMANFARKAADLGVNFIGLCCGNAPHFTRAMAEALGRNVPSSKYSPDMSKHPLLGDRAGL